MSVESNKSSTIDKEKEILKKKGFGFYSRKCHSLQCRDLRGNRRREVKSGSKDQMMTYLISFSRTVLKSDSGSEGF